MVMKNQISDMADVESLLASLYKNKSDYYHTTFNRLLPFSEMIVDRWKKERRFHL
jgi:hypothetical protein